MIETGEIISGQSVKLIIEERVVVLSKKTEAAEKIMVATGVVAIIGEVIK